jgi:Fe-S oxidoreductase
MARLLPEKYKEDLYGCLQCGYCRDACPVYEQIGWESATPRGKSFYLRGLTKKGLFDRMLGRSVDALIRRRAVADNKLAVRLYQCTSCGACEEVCHSNIKFVPLWEDVRHWINERGLGPMEAHKQIYSRVKQLRNPYNEPTENRAKWLPPDVKLSDKPEVVFFAGCTESYRMQPLAQASVRILSKAGVPFTVLGADEWCCCSPLLRTGQRDIVEEFIRHNAEAVLKTGAKTLVTACAGCYNTINKDHRKILGSLLFELYHISQYIEKLIKEGKLQLTKPVNKTVIYHDPCHLGRHAGVFDAPRNVLRAIPGLKLMEMKRIRKESRCCGAGGGVKSAFNDLAEDIAVARIKEAKESGAELIATSCPFCIVNLNAGAKRAGIDIKTVDVLELVMQAI